MLRTIPPSKHFLCTLCSAVKSGKADKKVVVFGQLVDSDEPVSLGQSADLCI